MMPIPVLISSVPKSATSFRLAAETAANPALHLPTVLEPPRQRQEQTGPISSQELTDKKPQIHNIHAMLEHCLARISQSCERAKQMDVVLAKKRFISKLFDVGIHGAALGGAIAITVLSGGTAIPLTALSAGIFFISVSDAACSLHQWLALRGGGHSLLPMGEDSLANMFYCVLRHCGVNEANACSVSNALSLLTRVTLDISLLFYNFFVVRSVTLLAEVEKALALVSLLKRLVASLATLYTGKKDFDAEHPRQGLQHTTDVSLPTLHYIVDQLKELSLLGTAEASPSGAAT